MDFLRAVWQRISQFCRCTEDLRATQGYEPSERTHLLSDPTNNSQTLRRTNSENFSQDICQSLPQKEDQNALCRLVQNTAINMIDVGAMDSHNLEHQEYNDRIKLYSQRLQQQWSNIQNPSQTILGLLKDVPSPEVLLSQNTDIEDLLQMRNALIKAHVALSDIRVEHKDAIVVPFQIQV